MIQVDKEYRIEVTNNYYTVYCRDRTVGVLSDMKNSLIAIFNDKTRRGLEHDMTLEAAVHTMKDIEAHMLKTVWSLQERGVIGNVQN